MACSSLAGEVCRTRSQSGAGATPHRRVGVSVRALLRDNNARERPPRHQPLDDPLPSTNRVYLDRGRRPIMAALEGVLSPHESKQPF